MTHITNTLVMVSPDHFGFNPETAQSNVFQNKVSDSESETQQKAMSEFSKAVKVLKSEGINILMLKSPAGITPDAIFPNNWFSHHIDGKLVIYPMLAPNRRAERQAENLKNLLFKNGAKNLQILDLTEDEKSGNILEGTGSLVLDRENKVAFATESPRTIKQEFEKWCKLIDYKGVLFHSSDVKDFPIYHTNVMMSIGREYAIICLESIKNISEREIISSALYDLKKEIIEISLSQISQYCGNTLQVLDNKGNPKIIMSKTAKDGFSSNQLKALGKYGKTVTLEIPEIETVGGGSARCMLGEVFLQQN